MLRVGESFVIGDTTFTVEASPISDSGLTYTCSQQELQQTRYIDADDRFALWNRRYAELYGSNGVDLAVGD